MIALFILIVAILNFILSFYVFINNPKSRLNVSFALSTSCVGLWVFLNFIFIKTNNIEVLRAIYALAPFIIVSIAWWIFCLKNDKPDKLFLRTNYVLIFFNFIWGILMFIGPHMIENVSSYTEYTTGIYFNIYAGYILILFILFIIYFLAIQYRKADKIFKDQIRLSFTGIIITIIIAAVVGFILPAFGITKFNMLDSPSSIFFVLFSFYSIIKYKFLNIRVIGTEVFATLLVFLSFIGLLRSIDVSDFVLSLIIFFVTIIFAGLLIRSVLAETRRREEVENLNVKLNKAAIELKAKAVHLEKLLQMRTEFLDIASHQLKTPISVIRGTISMFEEGSMDKVPEAKRKEFFHNIAVKADKLNSIISDILRASELDTDEFKMDDKTAQPEQLEDIIKSVDNQLHASASAKNIEMTIEAPKQKLPPVLTSGEFLEQAIYNLVDNAIKYTEKGFIKIILSQDGDNLIVKVSDSGIGIPAKEQKKVFDKFARGNNAVNMYADGSGLGLFIVKKIIEAHKGGQISVESKENVGTTFTVSLPAVANRIKTKTVLKSRMKGK
ncbi:MAG: ATP-binding protein [Candidatus Omnitrophota bacterium]